jgi:carboxylesterase type B
MNRSDPIVVVFLAWTLASMVAITVPAAEPEPTKSFTYKKTKQADLEIVVHYPPGWKETDKRPGIVFFFGGGWMGGTIRQFEPQATHLACRGMVSALADYRVKSRHGVTPKECVEDAKSAVRWLRQNAAKLGIDPDRIVAAGEPIEFCVSTEPAGPRRIRECRWEPSARLEPQHAAQWSPSSRAADHAQSAAARHRALESEEQSTIEIPW